MPQLLFQGELIVLNCNPNRHTLKNMMKMFGGYSMSEGGFELMWHLGADYPILWVVSWSLLILGLQKSDFEGSYSLLRGIYVILCWRYQFVTDFVLCKSCLEILWKWIHCQECDAWLGDLWRVRCCMCFAMHRVWWLLGGLVLLLHGWYFCHNGKT